MRCKIMVWYGDADINMSVHMTWDTAQQLRKARLREYTGDLHVTFWLWHEEEVLTDLLALWNWGLSSEQEGRVTGQMIVSP